MAKHTVLTIDDKPYLIPPDQAKDLTVLLERIGSWTRLSKRNYSEREFQHDGIDASPEIKVSILAEDRVTPLAPEPAPTPEPVAARKEAAPEPTPGKGPEPF